MTADQSFPRPPCLKSKTIFRGSILSCEALTHPSSATSALSFLPPTTTTFYPLLARSLTVPRQMPVLLQVTSATFDPDMIEQVIVYLYHNDGNSDDNNKYHYS